MHVLGGFLKRQHEGARPFAGFPEGKVAPSLRLLLGNLGVDRACDYRPHDLRRGHYMDMKDKGRTLYEILAAAGVTNPKSPRPYLDMNELEFDACMECHLQSDDEE